MSLKADFNYELVILHTALVFKLHQNNINYLLYLLRFSLFVKKSKFTTCSLDFLQSISENVFFILARYENDNNLKEEIFK